MGVLVMEYGSLGSEGRGDNLPKVKLWSILDAKWGNICVLLRQNLDAFECTKGCRAL